MKLCLLCNHKFEVKNIQLKKQHYEEFHKVDKNKFFTENCLKSKTEFLFQTNALDVIFFSWIRKTKLLIILLSIINKLVFCHLKIDRLKWIDLTVCISIQFLLTNKKIFIFFYSTNTVTNFVNFVTDKKSLNQMYSFNC